MLSLSKVQQNRKNRQNTKRLISKLDNPEFLLAYEAEQKRNRKALDIVKV